ncbi:MAG TPA: redoxin domain-containing protein [Desulfuromonadales bacterium]|nr:redoxin domain-containing protein [Desulfuromonadales bacterium]
MRIRIHYLVVLTFLLSGLGLCIMVPSGATLQGLQVGAEAPDFRLPSVTGESWTYAELKGEKLTLVVFWSTWSKKSAQALSDLQQLYDKYRDRGLSVIAINADGQTVSEEAMAAIKTTIAELKLEFPVLVDRQLATFHDFGVIALPSTVLLDGERNIRYELSGYPLVGAGELKGLVASALEGERAAVALPKQDRQPTRTALRYYNMGRNTLKSRRMAEAAETWFRKAIAEDPGFVLPHLGLAKVYAGRGDLARARTEYEQALAKEPGNAVALCEMGILLVQEGRLVEGQSLFARSLAVDEAYAPCYYYAGYAHGKQGDMGAALKMFEEAAAINRLDFEIYTYKGRMYEELGSVREAADAYRQAVEVILSLN